QALDTLDRDRGITLQHATDEPGELAERASAGHLFTLGGSGGATRRGAARRTAGCLIGMPGSGSGSPRRLRPGRLGLILSILLVVELDDLVRHIRLGVGIDDPGAASLDDEEEAAVLAHLLDQPRELLEDLLRRQLLLPLELLLQVLGHAAEIAHLSLEGLLL